MVFIVSWSSLNQAVRSDGLHRVWWSSSGQVAFFGSGGLHSARWSSGQVVTLQVTKHLYLYTNKVHLVAMETCEKDLHTAKS